jgi:hypothetical protein
MKYRRYLLGEGLGPYSGFQGGGGEGARIRNTALRRTENVEQNPENFMLFFTINLNSNMRTGIKKVRREREIEKCFSTFWKIWLNFLP